MTGPICTMPGKIGDVLLSLPVVREIAAMHRAPALLITSDYCAPLLPLLSELPYLRGAVALSESDYRIQHTDYGAQPWLMRVNATSQENVYHLGFRHFPVPGQRVTDLAGEPYEIQPETGAWLPLVRVDPDGPILVQLGTPNEIVGWAAIHCRPIRYLSTPPRRVLGDEILLAEDYLEIYQALDGCSMFVGAQSGPSKVAMGAGVPVVWPHREGVDQTLWTQRGCDVRSVDLAGRVRVLSQ